MTDEVYGKIIVPKINAKLSFHTISIDRDPYTGEYEVTPNMETQVLQTRNKALSENITINPIPSNYGLITYDGFQITVS